MKARPGKGPLGWMGRQVGYVVKAVKQDVGEKVLYRTRKVRQEKVPDRPDITLRRTTIDEAIQDHRPRLK